MWLRLVPRKKYGHENEITACAGPKLKKAPNMFTICEVKYARVSVLAVCPQFGLENGDIGTRN